MPTERDGETTVPEWTKDKLLRHGLELRMDERIRRYQHNIRTIRASGCAVPKTALINSLDPVEIELWFADSAFRSGRLKHAIRRLSQDDLTNDIGH